MPNERRSGRVSGRTSPHPTGGSGADHWPKMWTSKRTTWFILLAVVIVVPPIAFGLPALLRHPQIAAHPSPTAATPLLVSQACGLGSTASPSVTAVPVPTLGPPLPTPREGEVIGYDSADNDRANWRPILPEHSRKAGRRSVIEV